MFFEFFELGVDGICGCGWAELSVNGVGGCGSVELGVNGIDAGDLKLMHERMNAKIVEKFILIANENKHTETHRKSQFRRMLTTIENVVRKKLILIASRRLVGISN